METLALHCIMGHLNEEDANDVQMTALPVEVGAVTLYAEQKQQPTIDASISNLNDPSTPPQVENILSSSHDGSYKQAEILVTPQCNNNLTPTDQISEGNIPPVSLIDIDGDGNAVSNDALYCIQVVPPEPIPANRMCIPSKQQLQIGDHVYQWRSWMGIPGIFQHHGIIMDVHYEATDGDSELQTAKLTIADFSNVEHHSHSQKVSMPESVKQQRRRLSGLTQEGILRTYTDTDQWHKVEYQAPWWKRTVYRAGTCTSVASDAVGLVLARVNFILRHPDVLPDYHVVNANCECVAVWCKTGRWSTLQASSLLEITAAGQVKSSATLAATAASTQVTVQTPAAGLWGWLGYTTSTQVSWLSLHPFFIPALAGYAVLSVGVPAIMYVNARKQWKATTKRLKDAFWEDAMTNPEVFAECITHWSDK